MPIQPEIIGDMENLTGIRQRLHANPELAFEEHETSAFVAAELESYGIAVHRGLAGTGVVGTLSTAKNGPVIGLRADMDALPITETTDLPYASLVSGKMHACGHDGHTTMLLGAARYLARTRRFKGTVRFIFQPAEENVAGGRVMVEDGLFDLFPCDAIYAMHNTPGMPIGYFAVHSGPVMAAADMWDAKLCGRGGHAAYPHRAVDPVVIGAQIVAALQTIVSRTTDPTDSAVVSVTKFQAGGTHNIIPETAELAGTCRTHAHATRDHVEAALRRTIAAICDQHQIGFELIYDRRYPPTINTARNATVAHRAAATIAGEDAVLTNRPPYMGAEDFGWMLQECPGCYIRIGNGTEGAHGSALHTSSYDFNDAALPYGASFFATVVEQELPAT